MARRKIYDKKSSSPDNLIVLCRKCHMKTNTNREYWTKELSKLTVARTLRGV